MIYCEFNNNKIRLFYQFPNSKTNSKTKNQRISFTSNVLIKIFNTNATDLNNESIINILNKKQ